MTSVKVLAAILVFCSVGLFGPRANAQCPAFGADTTCGVVITVTDAGATATSTGQGPYDSIEDTLIGVVNNSNFPVQSLVLHSGLNRVCHSINS
jgi:hypothetical protein